MDLPNGFYPLPEYTSIGGEQGWSTHVRSAHSALSDIYSHAARILRQEEADTLRTAFHINAITSDGIPILSAMENEIEAGNLSLPIKWLQDSARLFGNLVLALREHSQISEKIENDVEMPELVKITRSGKRGAPSKDIDLRFLCEAVSAQREIKLRDLAAILGVHRNTLRAYMKKNNVMKQYSNLSNHDLDALLRTFKEKKPDSGLQYVVGFLRKHGIRVQQKRVVSSLRRIDGLGRVLRKRKAIKRTKYTVKRPNSLWHLDGHHKLIRWGIVLHGFVDGYSRTVTALRASTNNRAVTVLDLFYDAISDYGMPSRLRGDRGGENMACAIYMVLRRGPRRASFMWGSSTRNTRIERLWVEVGTHFARRWRAFFTRLEHMHFLDTENPVHLWLLHSLFLDSINEDCEDFKQTWNNHPIRGAGSPNDIRLLGQTRFGIYKDDCDGIHPDTINEYYGTDRKHPNTSDNVDPSIEDLAAKIHSGQNTETRHEGVAVAQGYNPFSSEAAEHQFYNVLENVIKAKVIPAGLGLLSDEWQSGEYPTSEVLKIGVRSRKEIEIELSDPIWYNRAVLWGQALSTLQQFYDSQTL